MSGGISLVGCETLLAGVVGTCVSTVGVAISDVVLTRAGAWCPTTVGVITVVRCWNQRSAVATHSPDVGSDKVPRLRCSTHYLTLTVLVSDPNWIVRL